MKIDRLQPLQLIPTILICGCMLIGCNNPSRRKDQINRIEIASGGCLHGCPAIGLRIDSTLKLIYYGGYKAKLQGYYEGQITQVFWDTLNMKLEQINFKKLDTSKYYGMIDGEPDEVIFYWDKQKKHIFKLVDDPDSVSNVLIWIANSYKHVQLHKLNDTVNFETTYQFMRPPTPKPKLDQVKFPPPKKRK